MISGSRKKSPFRSSSLFINTLYRWSARGRRSRQWDVKGVGTTEQRANGPAVSPKILHSDQICSASDYNYLLYGIPSPSPPPLSRNHRCGFNLEPIKNKQRVVGSPTATSSYVESYINNSNKQKAKRKKVKNTIFSVFYRRSSRITPVVIDPFKGIAVLCCPFGEKHKRREEEDEERLQTWQLLAEAKKMVGTQK